MLLADELRTIGLSEQLVTDVLTFLDHRAADLLRSATRRRGWRRLRCVTGEHRLRRDAAKAHDHVYKAITDMIAGLKGYQVSLHDMAKQTWDVDATTEAEIKTHIIRAESCVAPTFASPSTCTLPGASCSGDEG